MARRDLRAREARVPRLRRAGRVGSRKRSSCARSAAPSRPTHRSRHRQGRGARSDGGAARAARRRARLAGRRRSVQCQSCQAVMVFDAARVGQNCEFCGSPALVDYDEIKSPIRPQGLLPFRVDATRCATTSADWWRASGSRRDACRARRWWTRVNSLYIPYWTFDAQVALPVDGRSRPLLLRERRQGATARAGRVCVRNGACDGSRRPAWSTTSSTTSWCRAHRVCRWTLLRQVEPFPTQDVVPYDTAFLSGHVVEHYQVVLARGRAAVRSEQMHAMLEAALRAADPRRHPPQPAHPPAFSRPDVQARARAGLAAHLHVRAEVVSGDRQRLHRHASPGTIR